jgi:hypothetical protein
MGCVRQDLAGPCAPCLGLAKAPLRDQCLIRSATHLLGSHPDRGRKASDAERRHTWSPEGQARPCAARSARARVVAGALSGHWMPGSNSLSLRASLKNARPKGRLAAAIDYEQFLGTTFKTEVQTSSRLGLEGRVTTATPVAAPPTGARAKEPSGEAAVDSFAQARSSLRNVFRCGGCV